MAVLKLHSALQRWLLSFTDPRWVFLQALLVYFLVSLFGGSPFRTSDTNYFNYLADAFLHGQLYLRLTPNSIHDLVFFQNQYYLYWPPFPTLVLMPLVMIFGVGVSDVFITTLIGSLNVAGVSLLLRAAQQRRVIQLSETQRAWLTIFIAFGTVHMTLAPHGNVWFTAQVISFGALILAYWGAISLHGWKAFFVAGLGMAMTMSTRSHMIFAGIWPAYYLLSQNFKVGRNHLFKNILIGISPIVLVGGLILSYNVARFGTPFEVGLDFHQMAYLFSEDFKKYGAFNFYYFPSNFYYQFLFYPFPLSTKSVMGGSIFLLSPLFFGAIWALWKGRKQATTWFLFASILFVDIPILLLMGTGWIQFGSRYTLDFTVPLLILVANGIRNIPNRVIGLLIIISITHFLFGAYILLTL